MESKKLNLQTLIQKIPQTWKIAGGIFLLVVILFKLFYNPAKLTPSPIIPKVITQNFEAKEFTPLLSLTGHTEANVKTIIRSEIPGKVATLLVEKGKMVSKGTPLIALENADCLEKLAQAKATLEHKQAEFESATKLKNKDFYSKNSLLAAKADLELAKTTLARATYEAEQLTVKAPYDGLYDTLHVELGEYVPAGTQIITFLKPAPTKIQACVSEDEHTYVTLQKPCNFLIRGQNYAGTVTYVSQTADPKTRSYAVECLLNDGNTTFAHGVTATVLIPKSPVMAHAIPPSSLTLSDQGVLGVMVVADGKAQFQKIELIEAQHDKTLVSGLPAKIQLITVGGLFVKSGQAVQATEKTP